MKLVLESKEEYSEFGANLQIRFPFKEGELLKLLGKIK